MIRNLYYLRQKIRHNVYPHPNSPSTSQIDDLDHVDLTRFPDFPTAKQYRVVIGPGECIFVPSRWWHSARVVTTSVSVCTNMMHSTNWSGFVDPFLRPGRRQERSVPDGEASVSASGGAGHELYRKASKPLPQLGIGPSHRGTFAAYSGRAPKPLMGR